MGPAIQIGHWDRYEGTYIVRHDLNGQPYYYNFSSTGNCCSGPNTGSVHRRSVISHLVPADATFHPVHVDPVYSRYRRVDDLALDESFFPIVWRRDGYRTPWLIDGQDVAVRRPPLPA